MGKNDDLRSQATYMGKDNDDMQSQISYMAKRRSTKKKNADEFDSDGEMERASNMADGAIKEENEDSDGSTEMRKWI